MTTRLSPLNVYIVFTLLALLSACSPNNPNSNENVTTNTTTIPRGRLPQTAEPLHYQLALDIDPRLDNFRGRTQIKVQLHEPSQIVWLHGNKLRMQEVSATLTTGEPIAATYEQVDPIGVAKVTFAQTVPAGEINLDFVYTAPFNTSLEGLYKVVADNDAYVFTQFEVTSARLVFPGFDEPAFKVPFDITVDVAAEHKVASNTPVVQETMLQDKRRVQFQTTKPLPTYLLAFAVGPLDEVAWEPIAASNLRDTTIPLRGFAVRGKGEQLHYALQHTQEIVLALEDYFGIPYPYAKLDIIAAPDFAFGAMENAGAIVYREQLLLLNDDAPASQKIRYASVHTHELAHQWFGDLVTPEWWDDIWLNEAFATWMAGNTMHRIDPELGYKQRMLSSALNSMQLDRLVSARQIRQPITEHEEIGAAFDGITYQKGGAVLSMLEQFVGPENFRRGIHNYLNQFRFANATARDFVQAIAATRNDLEEGLVEQAFFSFLEQPGTPLVNINWQCENGDTTVTVEQQRYLPLGSTGDVNKQWLLPLCVTAVSNNQKQTHCEIMQNQSGSFNIGNDSKTCPDTLIPNADAAGYYRYALTPDAWQQLLQNPNLSEREFLSAADSLSAAFYAGELTVENFLSILPAVLRSDNTQVLIAPLGELATIYREMIKTSQRPAFAQQIGALYDPVYARIQLDRQLSTPDELQLRNTMLNLYAHTIKNSNLREQLRNKALTYTGFNTDRALHADALDVNIREVALSVAANIEGKPFVELLLEHFHHSNDALLREQILRATTYADDPAVLAQLRELGLSDDIRDNEVNQIIGPLMRDIDKRDPTWKWIRTHMDDLIARQPAWTKGTVIGAANVFCSQERYDEIKQEWSDKFSALESGPRTLANTLENIQLCSALVDHHRDNAQQLVGE